MMLATFSLAGILLGIINIIIVVAILLLVGAICQWVLGIIGFPPPVIVVKIFCAIVALIALYMFVALLLGLPSGLHVIG